MEQMRCRFLALSLVQCESTDCFWISVLVAFNVLISLDMNLKVAGGFFLCISYTLCVARD